MNNELNPGTIESESWEQCWERHPKVPAHLRDGLRRWVEDHIPPGSFLQHVLTNDLWGAIRRADPESLANMKAIAWWLANEPTSECWDSQKKVWDWCRPECRDRLCFSEPAGDRA